MTVTSAAVRLPRYISGAGPQFGGAGFQPLYEKPVPTPAEDRLAEQNAAVAQTLAAAQAEFDAARAADQAEFERRIAERETQILTTIGDALAVQVAEGFAKIEERVGHHVGAVLLHFLDHAVRERAVDELCEAVSVLLAGGSATRVRIAGPAALSRRVEAAIGQTGVTVERADGDAADVSVTIDETIMETNCAAWMDRLMAQAGAANDG